MVLALGNPALQLAALHPADPLSLHLTGNPSVRHPVGLGPALGCKIQVTADGIFPAPGTKSPHQGRPPLATHRIPAERRMTALIPARSAPVTTDSGILVEPRIRRIFCVRSWLYRHHA